ncbi:hypothetical protein M409DRAFT_24230 [Zasmidium cellare ATCC 36951]|uniref:Uncharacterized protein n=1 Tax=Zasmidium cellare ATCC 36951 TaxID=1080233 RepID=A0A6A6CGR5_ZASCE|nr:uncharacterized protein M409DRAFT_24230 [Zasmidium cellare ATCC 36951]KAF2165380.1 hypothetical protein M409DRAFT_24230 [Zasmidium cellare ATCC 36951]
MTLQERFNELNRQMARHKAEQGNWASRKQTCIGNIQSLQNQNIDPNNLNARHRHRHELTAWRNRLNEAREKLADLNDLMNRKHGQMQEIQQKLSAHRRQQQPHHRG